MKDKLQGWAARFDAMSLRERVLVLATLVVALVLPLFMYVIEPDQKAQAALRGKVAKLKVEVANKTLERVTLKSTKKVNPNVALKARIATLKEQVGQLNEELAQRSSQLVTPREMLGVLQAALSEHPGLALVRAQKGAAQRFQSAEQSKQESGIYRHDLTLVVEGGYFDVLRYLQSLEKLPKGFFWDAIDYRVEEHPRATVTLSVHTLSTEEGWLGV